MSHRSPKTVTACGGGRHTHRRRVILLEQRHLRLARHRPVGEPMLDPVDGGPLGRNAAECAAVEAEGRGDPVSSDDAGFADFYRRVSQAEGIAETEAVAAVRTAEKGWQAHMTYLERRFANRWRQQSGVRYANPKRDTRSLEDILDAIETEQRRAG
jgi:hypothetical protein